jgi:hypothetical protein
LIQNPEVDEFDTYMNESRPINPKDNHISFQVLKKKEIFTIVTKNSHFEMLWKQICRAKNIFTYLSIM